MSFKNWTSEMVDAHNAKILSRQWDKGLHAPSRNILNTRQGLTPGGPKNKRKPAYTPKQVMDWCESNGIQIPMFEFRFHPSRMWRLDIAWAPASDKPVYDRNYSLVYLPPKGGVAIEVQGGIWIRGGHSRGAAQKNDWEKLHEAQLLGWKMIYVEPKDLLTKKTAELVKKMLSC